MTQGDFFFLLSNSVRDEGGGDTEQTGGRDAVEQNLGKADREPPLAVCLTQTIKTAEARIQNFSEQ